MRVIIAGGRDFIAYTEHIMKLDEIAITEVVSGCALGADRFGENYAKAHGIPVRHFPANWTCYGKAAGPMRNRKMAEYADAVILFPGGRGTLSMKREAERAGLVIYDYMDI